MEQAAAWAPELLRPDWFESYLQQFMRMAGAMYRIDRRRIDLAYQVNEAVALLSGLGQRRLVSAIRRMVKIVDLVTGTPVRSAVDPLTGELLAAVFLNKHIRALRTFPFDEDDAWSYLGTALRMSGQPLGILRMSAGSPKLYWWAASPKIKSVSYHVSLRP